VLLYGYATGVRSSRRIEERLRSDVGFMFLAGQARPHHKTIGEFRRRHLAASSALFLDILVQVSGQNARPSPTTTCSSGSRPGAQWFARRRIYPSEPSMRLVTDILEIRARELKQRRARVSGRRACGRPLTWEARADGSDRLDTSSIRNVNCAFAINGLGGYIASMNRCARLWHAMRYWKARG
jgi:hypothetical protein